MTEKTEQGQPAIRVRIGHTRTQRDGWGYESTVEITLPGNDWDAHAEMAESMASLLALARRLGENEATIRNRAEGREVPAVEERSAA